MLADLPNAFTGAIQVITLFYYLLNAAIYERFTYPI